MIPIEIPNRALFRQSEVCEIAQIQPYVLRSWEAEFPQLGIARRGGGPRVYRRGDVEQVLRLKELLFVEGLTLAGARRKLEEELGGPRGDPEDLTLDEMLAFGAREQITRIKQGLQGILQILARDGQEAPTGHGEHRRRIPRAKRQHRRMNHAKKRAARHAK